MMPILRYTVLRILVFLVIFGGLWLISRDRVSLLLVLALALLVSGLVSLYLLRRQRDEMAGRVADRVRRTRSRVQESTRAEDAEDERRRQAHERSDDEP
jgi:Protein of unknown function (DUF4229)